MTKPMNFPERKRQRQIKALSRLQPFTKSRTSNIRETEALLAAVAKSKRDVKTKKVRA